MDSLLSNSALSQEAIEFGNQIAKRPKVELHVHLEAAVKDDFYAVLNNRTQKFVDENLPSRRAPFLHFSEFIRAWIDNTLLIENEADIENMVLSFADQRSQLNIVYSDVHISPSDFSYLRSRLGNGTGIVFDFGRLLRAYCRGAQKAAFTYPNIWFRFIVDLVWLANEPELGAVEQALLIVLNSNENQDPRGGAFIRGVGLGGPETPANLGVLSKGILAIRKLGLKLEIHTGETTDWKQQQLSMSVLQPDRVAHGLSGAMNGKFGSGHTIFCPISNIRSGAAQKLIQSQTPLKVCDLPFEQFDSGDVSLGSDDPLLFQTNLVFEYVVLFNEFGCGTGFFDKTQKAAIAAAFDQEAVAKALNY